MQPSMTPSPSDLAARGHLDGLADPAGLRELDVDPMRALRTGRDVAQRMAVLVHVDREGRPRFSRTPAGIAGRERLLDVLDAQAVERTTFSSASSSPQYSFTSTISGRSVVAAYGADALHVEAVPAAQLELQAAEARIDPLGAAGHVVGIAEPDRPRGRRARRGQAEEPPDGQAGQLAAQVVERHVERRLGRASPGLPASRAWISSSANGSSPSSSAASPRNPCADSVALAVVLLRRSLAHPRDAVRPQLDPDERRVHGVSREIVNGSASGTETARWVSSTAATVLGRTRL